MYSQNILKNPADMITDLETVILDVSDIFPNHPEQNRFAHALVDAIREISCYPLRTKSKEELKVEMQREEEHRQYHEKETKKNAETMAKLKAALYQEEPIDVIEQAEENDSDDEDGHDLLGMAASRRFNFLKEYGLTELPRRKKNAPVVPLLHEDKIQKIKSLWNDIKTLVTDKNPKEFLRVKRLSVMETIFKLRVFNGTTIKLLLDVPMDFIEQVVAAMAELDNVRGNFSKAYSATMCDINLIFSNFDRAKLLAFTIRWLNQHDLLNDSHREMILRIPIPQLGLLKSFSIANMRIENRTLIGQAIWDRLTSFPAIQLLQEEAQTLGENHKQKKPEYVSKRQHGTQTDVRVKTKDLADALSLHHRFEAKHKEVHPAAKREDSNQLCELLAHAAESNEFTPELTEGQLYELAWLTMRATDPVRGRTKEHEFSHIQKEAQESQLAIRLFGSERAEYLSKIWRDCSFSFATCLAVFFVDSQHISKINESLIVAFNHCPISSILQSNIFGRYETASSLFGPHETASAIVKVLAPFIEKDDAEQIESVGKALNWLDYLDLLTPERLLLIKNYPLGVGLISNIIWNDMLFATRDELEKIAVHIFDVLVPVMVAKHNLVNSESREVNSILKRKRFHRLQESDEPMSEPVLLPFTEGNPLRVAEAGKSDSKVSVEYKAKVSDSNSKEIQVYNTETQEVIATLSESSLASHFQFIHVSPHIIAYTTIENTPPKEVLMNLDGESDNESEEESHNRSHADENSMHKKLKVWNLKTNECLLTVDCDLKHSSFYDFVGDDKLCYQDKNALFVFNVKTQEKYRWLLPVNVNEVPFRFLPRIKSIKMFQGRLLVHADQGLALLNFTPEEKRVNYMAKITDLFVLEDAIIYTHARKFAITMMHVFGAGGSYTQSPETDIQVIKWDAEMNRFKASGNWRVPHCTNPAVVTPDRVMLYGYNKSLYVLDLDNPAIEPMALWRHEKRDCRNLKLEGDYLTLTFNNDRYSSRSVQKPTVYHYQLEGIKNFLKMHSVPITVATHSVSFWNQSSSRSAAIEEVQNSSPRLE